MVPRRVLVVDGDPKGRAGTVRCLRERGHAVTGTGHGAEAIQIVTHEPIGCVIVDVELADGSGLEVIHRLRQVHHRLPVIVTAKENTRELEALVRQHPILFYYIKDFGTEELLTAVQEALGVGGGPTMKKVLVIDDDADFRAALKDILVSGGYEVHEADGRAQGAERFDQVQPDLVILDIMMETTTSGFHWLYEARATEKGKHVPVLSVSSIAEKTGMKFVPGEDTQEGDFFPADDFMEKPVKPDELLKRVKALLSGGAAAGPCAQPGSPAQGDASG